MWTVDLHRTWWNSTAQTGLHLCLLGMAFLQFSQYSIRLPDFVAAFFRFAAFLPVSAHRTPGESGFER